MNEEATEMGLLPGTPEIINSEEDGRNSTGKAATAALLAMPKDDGKVLPHYLRTSVGSCHDFCKYGRKHSFRSKGKHHTFPLLAGSRTTPEKEQNRVKILSLAERRKKSSVKQKASAHLKTGLYDKHVIFEEESLSPMNTVELAKESEIINRSTPFLEKTGLSEGSEVTKCNLPSPCKKIESFDGSESIKQGAPFEGTILCDDPETSIEEMSSMLKKTGASGNSETANIKNPVKKNDSPLEPASTERKTGSSKNPFTSLKTKIMQKVPLPVKKAMSSGKSKVSNQEAPSPAKRSDAFATPALSGRSKGTTLKSIPPLNPTAGITSKKCESKRVTNVDLPNHGEKKILKPPSASLSSHPTLNRVSSFTFRKVKITRSSSVKHPKKVEKTERTNEKIKEKTLYVIGPRSAVDKCLEAAQSCPSSSSLLLPSSSEEKYRHSESASVSKHGRAKIKKTAQNEDKKSWRKVVTNHPEDKDPTAHKLKFRRGKVVDPQFVNDGPRKLVFRQGRKMGDNQSGKVGKRSFKRRELACGDLNQLRPEVEIVVLKHQDVPDKRETQGLFNHVIEETANKLVETRMSKVKALVGAFETVISLQESKPAASV